MAHNLLKKILADVPAVASTSSAFWNNHDVKHAYCLLITGRCGSTLLGKILSQLGIFGNPEEFFTEEMLPHLVSRYNTNSFDQLLPMIIDDNKRNNTFGFQIDPLRLSWILEYWDLGASIVDKSMSIAVMKRYDLLSQAYSYLSSKSSGIWHVFSSSDSSFAFSPDSIMNIADEESLNALTRRLFIELRLILQCEKDIETFLAAVDIVPVSITYEEFISDRFFCLYKLLRGLGAENDTISGLIDRREVITSNPTKKTVYHSKEMLFDHVYKNYRHIALVINESRSDMLPEIDNVLRQQ